MKFTRVNCVNFSICSDHKEDGMVNLICKKRCRHETCKKWPTYNFLGEKGVLFCKEHSKEGMVDIYHTCKSEWCDTYTKKSRNRGFCVRCFANLFPNETSSKRYRTKEKAVAEYVQKEFPERDWKFDAIAGGCSKRRPDIYVDLMTHVIIVEVDENKHQGYNCENKRMCEILEDFAHRPIVFVRFNPDGYKDDNGKAITSCWGDGVIKRNKKKEWDERLNILSNSIREYINNIPEKTLSVEHLFYGS